MQNFQILRATTRATTTSALMVLFLSSLALPAPAEEPVDFAHQVAPLLESRCAKCHTNGTYKGGVSLDSRESMLESAVTAGDVALSPLVDRVESDDPEFRMPPEGEPLTDKEIAVLKLWIQQGAPWEEGFSFREPTYQPPLDFREVKLQSWQFELRNPIDRILVGYLFDYDAQQPAPTADSQFLRRIYLDLVGVLPEPDALSEFVAGNDPLKRAWVVRQLLDDRVAYADHWLTFWNDLLRNDYAGTGYIDGGRQQITEWLYGSLLENKPYDQFVAELISPTPASEGFVKGIVWRGRVNASQRPELQFAQNVGQVFLGVNLKCASCHDSFIDDWKLTDAYGLAAICSEEKLELHRCDKPIGETATPHFLFDELGDVDPDAPRDQRLEQLAKLMTHPRNGRMARTLVNRLWQRLMGRGIVHPVDVMSNRPWSEDLLDYLALHLKRNNYNLKATLELIVNSNAYQWQCVDWDQNAPAEEYVFQGPIARRMTAEQFVDALWQITDGGPGATANDKLFLQAASPGEQEHGRPRVRSSLVRSTPLMATLGRPNREQTVTTRPAELTTLEAIALSNGAPLAELLNEGAARLLESHAGSTADEIVSKLYRTALSRLPTEQESRLLSELIGNPITQQGLADALWCIVMLPEFQLIQ